MESSAVSHQASVAARARSLHPVVVHRWQPRLQGRFRRAEGELGRASQSKRVAASRAVGNPNLVGVFATLLFQDILMEPGIRATRRKGPVHCVPSQARAESATTC